MISTTYQNIQKLENSTNGYMGIHRFLLKRYSLLPFND